MQVLLISLALWLAGAAQEGAAGGAPATPSPEPPQVRVEPQPGSPLRIVSVKTKWAVPDRSGIELYITVENAADKAVSAYATRDAAGGEKSGRHCLLIGARSPGKALRPGRSEGRSTWTGHDPSVQLRRVVDFVEFTDGSTWGEDLCGFAEGLSSSRAGAREARRRLRGVFKEGGADAVVESLKPDALKPGPPEGLEEEWRRFLSLHGGDERRRFEPRRARPADEGPPWAHSVAWWSGYIAGFEAYLDRVRREVQEWGDTEVEHALGRPVDALEERER